MTLYNPKPPEEKSLAQKVSVVFIVILAVSFVTLAYLIGLRQPQSSTQDGSVVFTQTIQEFTPGQALTVSSDNVTVYLPEDSTDLEGNVSIFPREPNLLTASDELEFDRPHVVNIEFRTADGPTNLTFTNPVHVCFTMTEDQWQEFVLNPGLFQVQYYAEEKDPPVWELLPMATIPAQFQLCGQTYHLSLFALAIRTQVGIPVTGPTLAPRPGTGIGTGINPGKGPYEP
jgi:hypothetical protein